MIGMVFVRRYKDLSTDLDALYKDSQQTKHYVCRTHPS